MWLVFFDGEEAIKGWTDADSTYGSKHLADKWHADGTLKRIKAFLLADMIGDKDLDVVQGREFHAYGCSICWGRRQPSTVISPISFRPAKP